MITRKQLRLKGYDYRQPNAYFITICCYRRRHLFGHIASQQMHLNAHGQFAHDQWLALASAYPHITLGEFVIMPNHMHGVIYVGEWDYWTGGGDPGGTGNGGAGGGDPVGAGDGGAGGDPGGDGAGGGDPVGAGDGGAGDGGAGGKAGGGKPLPYGDNDDGVVREGLAPSRHDASSRHDAPSRHDTPAHNGPPPTISAIVGAYKSLTYRDCLTLAKKNNQHLGKLWHRSFYENIIRTPESAARIRQYIRNNVRTWARDKFYGK